MYGQVPNVHLPRERLMGLAVLCWNPDDMGKETAMGERIQETRAWSRYSAAPAGQLQALYCLGQYPRPLLRATEGSLL